MPIQLSTSFDPGDADSGSLTHVRIESMSVNIPGKTIELVTRHGTYSEGVWTDGVVINGKTRQRFIISGEDYDDIVDETVSSADAKIYDDVAECLYQWLIDEGHFAGTIV